MNEEQKPDVAKQAKKVAENVSKQLEAATAGLLPKRVMGTFVDFVMIGVIGMVVNVIAFTILPPFISTMVWALVLGVSGIAVLLRDAPYTLGPLENQSIGKKAMNLRVLTLDGQPITMAQSIRRNLLLSIPFFLSAVGVLLSWIPFLGPFLMLLVAMPTAFVSFLILAFELFNMYKDTEQHRRWGDISAGTVVRFD